MLKILNIPIFTVTLILGLIAVYMLNENDKRKIFVYPTPSNVDKLLYRDGTSTCYKFEQKEIPCPKDRGQIAKVPIQA
jgi:hypothetical protein